jgi:hypothetical protein
MLPGSVQPIPAISARRAWRRRSVFVDVSLVPTDDPPPLVLKYIGFKYG